MDKGTSRQTLRLYWKFSKPYRKYTFGNLLIFPILVLLQTQLTSLVVANIIDDLATGNVDTMYYFLPSIALLIIFAVTNIVLAQLNLFLLWRHENYTVTNLYKICFDTLINESAAFHANRFSGSLVSQVGKFSHSYERLYDTAMFNVYTLVCSVAMSTILLWLRSPSIALVVLFFTLLFAITVVIQYQKQIRLNVRWSQAESRRTGQIADSLTNILAVKSGGTELHEKSLFNKTALKVRDLSDKTMKVVIRKELLLDPISSTAGILAVVLAIMSVTWWDQPIGTVVLTLTLTRDIISRVWNLNPVMRNLNRTFGDAHDMTEILSKEKEVVDVEDAPQIKINNGSVVFSNVTFKHSDAGDGEVLFENLNLDIKPGERIGLIGPSGGGKTTITKLLLRFMDIDSGQITIDDQDIAKVKQQSLRSHIAYVPQEPLLFHRSLAENIGYGRPAASQAEIEAAAKSAHAHEFISKLPKGYDTKVGERGVKLSGGQRQRIAIARAILKDAPILILDEATSALDSSSEVHIQKALWELMKDRTALVIAHRLSTVQKMDRIIVLDEGRIVEQGKHEELLKSKGLYSELWSHQSGGFISE